MTHEIVLTHRVFPQTVELLGKAGRVRCPKAKVSPQASSRKHWPQRKRP